MPCLPWVQWTVHTVRKSETHSYVCSSNMINIILLSPFYRLESWSIEKLRSLLKITLVSDWLQAILHYDIAQLTLKKQSNDGKTPLPSAIGPLSQDTTFFPFWSPEHNDNVSGYQVGLHSKHLQPSLLLAAPGLPFCLFKSRLAPIFTCCPLN